MAEDREPYTFARYIDQAITNKLVNLHTCLPGKITEFDSDTQLAKIQPLLKRIFVNNEVRDLPVCINCPVIFPRAGGIVMTFPVQAGDECMIMFAERALDTWLQSGGTQQPLDTRRHELSDAIAILGLYSQPNSLDSFYAGGIEIKDESGNVFFRLSSSGIEIKGNVDIDGDVDIAGESTATDHISGSVSGNSHVHGGVEPGGGSTGGPV